MVKPKEAALSLDSALQVAYARRAEELHNAMVELLVAHKADVYTTLFVIEMIRWTILDNKYKELFS